MGCPPQLAGAWALTESPCFSPILITSRYGSSACTLPWRVPLCWTGDLVGLDSKSRLWAGGRSGKRVYMQCHGQKIRASNFTGFEPEGILSACISWGFKKYVKFSICIISLKSTLWGVQTVVNPSFIDEGARFSENPCVYWLFWHSPLGSAVHVFFSILHNWKQLGWIKEHICLFSWDVQISGFLL